MELVWPEKELVLLLLGQVGPFVLECFEQLVHLSSPQAMVAVDLLRCKLLYC